MTTMTYAEKATEIIKNSIKSAIFIDEEAVDFYTSVPDEKIIAEKLSKNLFENFRDHGVSLVVNKYDISKKDDANYLDYLLKRRDLILLDWKLEGNSGEDHSLNILSKIIETKSIHFCTIYTSERNTNSIINNIRSYFSGNTTDYYRNVREELDAFSLEEITDKVSFESSNNGYLYRELIDIDMSLPDIIKEITGIKNICLALVQIKITFLRLHTSDVTLPALSYVNETTNTLKIDSTIISIISKDEDSYDKIIKKLREQLESSPNNFIELLGLDMQSLISDNSSFVDVNILNIDFETLLNHRKQIIANSSEEEFNNFINSILIEQAKTNLQNSNLSILESSFIDKQSESLAEMTNENICKLNSFYNGSRVNNKEKISFGDIFFEKESNTYYLCITALCDCLHPDIIDNKFFFVKGTKNGDLDKMIASEDSGFKSYIGSNIVIPWAVITEEKDSIKYIKPLQIFIPDTSFTKDVLIGKVIDGESIVSLNFEYMFTLKEKYAQRIANHAFNHPVRVGVDFVKK